MDSAQAHGAWQLRGVDDAQRLRAAPGQAQVVLEARTEGGSGPRFWLLNGHLAAQSQGNETVRLKLSPGQHRLTVMDGAGRFESKRLEVR
jgi:membrane carboxypeptidase/penicillin-binding protein PbpC